MGSVGQPQAIAGGSCWRAMVFHGWVWSDSCVSTWMGLVGQLSIFAAGPVRAAMCLMATLSRSIGELDGNREAWMQYAERLAHFFTANQITDQDRKKANLHCLFHKPLIGK